MMSNKLASQIKDLHVEPGSLAIFWLAQAGFVYEDTRRYHHVRRRLP